MLDYSSDPDHQIYIRLYSAIASSPVDGNILTDSRADVVQSILDLIDGNIVVPSVRLIDKLNLSYDEKVSQISSLGLSANSFFEETYSADELDRLNQLTASLGTISSTIDESSPLVKSFVGSLEYRSDPDKTDEILTDLKDVGVLNQDGVFLNAFGQPVQTVVDGISVDLVVSDFALLSSVFINTDGTSFTSDFIENDEISST